MDLLASSIHSTAQLADDGSALIHEGFTEDSNTTPIRTPPPGTQLMYRRAASETGALRAMINWYRGAVFSAKEFLSRSNVPMLDTPTLMVWGERDLALGREMSEGTDEYVSDLTVRYFPDASHWVQQDEPEAVNAMLAAFLRGEPVPERADLP